MFGKNRSIPNQTTEHTLNRAWLMAAVVGSVWAAIEIVLGSFLHNIRLPMTGTILTACGVCLVVAGQSVLKEPGLIWRAGLICALMKSISPSGVIFGPMIGIFSEALLVQLSVAILGRNAAGFLVGGALALTEPVFHRMVEYLMYYGYNAAELYVRLYEFAARSLHIQSIGPLEVILLFFAVNMLLGVIAGGCGMLVAARALKMPPLLALKPAADSPSGWKPINETLVFHPTLLVVHIVVLVSGFVAISKLPWWISASFIGVYSLLALWHYLTIRRRFRKVRLWIEIILVGVLASVLLGNLTYSEPGWTWQGLEIGLQMALRAVLVIIAFAALSTELRNPRIINWFMRRGWGSVSAALEVAFAALPTTIAALGEEKQFFRHPLQSAARVLAAGIQWLDKDEFSPSIRTPVYVIIGEQGAGKTTALGDLVRLWRARGKTVQGILAVSVWKENQRIGYDMVEIATSQQVPLCRQSDTKGSVATGCYTFDERTIVAGENGLMAALNNPCDLIIIDEIGPLELSGKCWAKSLDNVLQKRCCPLLIAVRPQCLDQVMKRWKISPVKIWEAGKIDAAAMAEVMVHAGNRKG